jgi:hypothetical protein
MALSIARVRHYLREFALDQLLIEELGWDRHAAQLTVQMDGQTYTLNALAEKRGVQVFQCQPDVQGNIPEYASRRKIEQQVSPRHNYLYVSAELTRPCLFEASFTSNPATQRQDEASTREKPTYANLRGYDEPIRLA